MEEKEMKQFYINEERRTIKDLLYLCGVFGIRTKNTHVAENIIMCKVSLSDLYDARVRLAKDFVNCLSVYDVDDIDTILKVKFIMDEIMSDESEGGDNEKLS